MNKNSENMQTFSIDALLALYSIPAIGPTRMRKLISIFKTPQAVLEASARKLLEIEGVDRGIVEKIKAGPDESFVQRQRRLLESYNVQLLTYWDEDYPEVLKKIYDPPAFLFIKGKTQLLKGISIAIVGTRHPTEYGKWITEKLSSELAKSNITVISGFARGVDTIAHKTVLNEGGTTIAVFGNGLDRIYPSENKNIYDQIQQKGLLISEYPMGTKPDAGNFPRRNRIISGLCKGVIITEAGAKSGALITAYYANDQNREVFAVPGQINSKQSTGTNDLIKQGA
ncbi:MAG: DNA-protecting protein DprA, partial [Caldithrix sp.]|nr:DNA-protecting protein DprA [Caldithrix sp.]